MEAKPSQKRSKAYFVDTKGRVYLLSSVGVHTKEEFESWVLEFVTKREINVRGHSIDINGKEIVL